MLAKWDLLISLDSAVEEFLLPFVVRGVQVEGLQSNPEGIGTGREDGVLIANMNISDFDLEVIDNAHAESLYEGRTLLCIFCFLSLE